MWPGPLLLTDKRLKPAEKVLAAAVWDLAAPVGRDPGPAAPRKVYRAALADRTGMGASTISRKLSDLDNMGVISLERKQTGLDHTELWIGVGTLPPCKIRFRNGRGGRESRDKTGTPTAAVVQPSRSDWEEGCYGRWNAVPSM